MRSKIFLIFVFVTFVSSAQQNKESIAKEIQKKLNDQHTFFVGGGVSLTSVNIFKNYKTNPYALGYDIRAFYELDQVMRLMGQYTLIPNFDFSPTWLDLRSHTVEAGFNLMANILDQEANFYTISTLCFQSFKGFYTGLNDFSNQKNIYIPNTIQKENYVGISLGAGFERSFVNSDLFLDFRYRFAVDGRVFTISDAAYSLGWKKRITTKKLRRVNRMFDKYDWF